MAKKSKKSKKSKEITTKASQKTRIVFQNGKEI